ncbi:MAG: hydroxymethylglutaryl-CoA lyase, partial [candidate division WOR-3 bacterium]
MKIYITEVAPRDGLQNIKELIETDKKVKFINLLSETGVDEIEVSSFVHPKWVPQLADAEDVFQKINRKEGVIYSAIVPNEKGLERALKVKPDKIAVLTAASDTFNRKNINTDIEGSFKILTPVVKNAKAEGLKVRGYVSTSFWCPYEGKVSPYKVREIALRLLELGVDEVSLGDTIGRASPKDVSELLELILKDVDLDKVVLHFHATYGMGIANVVCSYRDFGIYRFDSSAGGLGGCPYAPGASGN